MSQNFLKEYSTVIKKISEFEKEGKFNWDILIRIGTFHLKNPKYLKDKISKSSLSLQDIKYITNYQRGLINFELSGNIFCSMVNNKNFIFNLNKGISNWDFNSRRPNTSVVFNYKKEENKNLKGFWHLHPWNSMNLKDKEGIHLPNFFSIEDIDAVFTYPKHLFVIFNMESPNKLKYPCIYILFFNPDLINFHSNPTKWQKIITGYQRILVPFIYNKMSNKDDKIDWEDIKKTFLSIGILFEYSYSYNNEDIYEKINNIFNINLPNCK
jgi:hypothetical protein